MSDSFRLIQMDNQVKEGDEIGPAVVIDVFEDADGRQWVLLMEEV